MKAGNGQIIADQKVEILCERIPVASYEAIRSFGSDIVKAISEEIVLRGPGFRVSSAGQPLLRQASRGSP